MNLVTLLIRVGGMTLLSRIFGFIRDAMMARIFGAGMASDAFLAAFRIPNLLRRISAEGAFSQAFVPVFAEYVSLRQPSDTRQLLNCIATCLGMILVIITVLGMLASPWVVMMVAPGFKGDKYQLTVDLLRITFPYIFFISLVSLAGSVLNVFNRFYIPAFTPVWLNICLIISMIWFAEYFSQPITALAWGVLVGGGVQLAFQVPFLRQIGMLPRWDWNWRDLGVQRILRLMAPAMLGVSVAQVSLVLNTIFASFLVVGSVSWLYYADRLMELPTGVLGAALGTVLLPNLSKAHALADKTAYRNLLDWGLRLSVLLATPAAVGLAVLATPLVVTLFNYGRFNIHDVAMTKAALIGYSVGLLALIAIKILASGFYARQDIKTPVKIGIFSLFCTQVFNLILVFGLKMNHAGLALAISLGALLNASLLLWALCRNGTYQAQSGWVLFLCKVSLGLLLMGAALLLTRGDAASWINYTLWQRLLHLSALLVLGAGVYFITLFAVGIRLSDYMQKVKY